MDKVHIIINGFVQGIFFRSFIKERANELDLKGYARNLDRDKVEIIVEGHEAKINKFMEIIKKGPPGAEVKDLKAVKQPYKGEFKQFTIRH